MHLNAYFHNSCPEKPKLRQTIFTAYYSNSKKKKEKNDEEGAML